MTLSITTASSGSYWTNDFDTVEELRAAIDRGVTFRVWWYTAWGQRYSEEAWFAIDDVKQIRTESDD